MALSPLGCATRSIPDFIRTELRTVLAIAFGDRNDRPCNPSQVAVSPTILTWQRELQLREHRTLKLPAGY